MTVPDEGRGFISYFPQRLKKRVWSSLFGNHCKLSFPETFPLFLGETLACGWNRSSLLSEEDKGAWGGKYLPLTMTQGFVLFFLLFPGHFANFDPQLPPSCVVLASMNVAFRATVSFCPYVSLDSVTKLTHRTLYPSRLNPPRFAPVSWIF